MSSAASVWPKYARFSVDDLTMLWRFVISPGNLRSPLIVAVLLALYLAGVFTPLPGDSPLGASATESWWFLTLLDSILTGGALGRGAIFAMGTVAPLLIASRRQQTPNIFRFLLGHLRVVVGAGMLVAFFGWRAEGALGVDVFVRDTVLLALGGIAVYNINRKLIAHHGPQVTDVNIALTLVGTVAATVRESDGDRTAVAWLAATIGFISVSAYVLLRSRTSIEVKNISFVKLRTAVLQFSPVAEPLLDSVATLTLVLYVPLAGLASLLLGWRTLTADNSPFFLTLALVALGCVWLLCRAVSRVAAFSTLLREESLFGTSSPQSIASRMFNNFWIIPGVKPGPDTEETIRRRMSGIVTGAFLLFALWFLIAIATEQVVLRNGGTSPFPSGPVVFVLMLLTIVGYMSMLSRYVHGSMNHFKQLWRGRSRLLADTYPLSRPGALSQLPVGGEAERYWQEDKVVDDWRDLVEWLKLARDLQPRHASHRGGRVSAKTQLLRWTATGVVAVVVSFLAGAVCVVFYPDLSRRDLVLIVLPTLVTTLIAPEPLLKLLRKFSGR